MPLSMDYHHHHQEMVWGTWTTSRRPTWRYISSSTTPWRSMYVSWYWIYIDIIPQLIAKNYSQHKTQGTHFYQFDPFCRNPDKVMIYFEDEEWTFRSGKTLSCDQSEKFLFQGCWAVFKQACKPFSRAGIQVSGDENKYNGLNLLMTIVCNKV